ncbi:NAD(P)-dependent malic enzyme [Peptoniphilaceae bacterium SGI.131]
MDVYEKALKLHEEWQGKVGSDIKSKLNSKDDLQYAYTPGVAEPCRQIHKDKSLAYKYTSKANTIAVISDGSAVLGLGNIGAEAAMPVMEGKAVLFKHFGDVNAVPIVLDTQDENEIIETVKNLAPTFGGINLEDISSPRCVTIENKLKEMLDIPVFHDDQHGTAIVVTAALINSLRLVKKEAKNLRVVVSGAGAAGYAIIKMIRLLGVEDILVFDSKGIINADRASDYNFVKKDIANITNKKRLDLTLREAMKGADLFIGVSAPKLLDKDMVASMNKDAIIFALANPVPEIDYYEAKEAGARIVGTGRSDFPNQINNILAFPGIFKGALQAKAKQITEDMKMAAALAIAKMVDEKDLTEEFIIPEAINKEVALKVSQAVQDLA